MAGLIIYDLQKEIMNTKNFDRIVQDFPPLTKFPRAELFSDRTILERLPYLSRKLDINLFIKRDDTLPLCLGGNKVRQLEFYLGEAVKNGSDTILITGSIQSNFVRLCAAASRKLGMQPVVQLEKRVPNNSHMYNSSGNVLLLKMLGAKIISFSEGEDEAHADANLDIIANNLRAEGAKPYTIHLGTNHPPIGALGYIAAAVETLQQARGMNLSFDHVVLPSGSALTHAGFLAGVRFMKQNINIHGICVRRASSLQKKRALLRTNEIGRMVGKPNIVGIEDIYVDDTCLEPGYGRVNKNIVEALSLSAIQEGIILDPVYSGKAFAGLIHLTRNGTIARGKNVLFIHTGGTPANFGYQSEIESMTIDF